MASPAEGAHCAVAVAASPSVLFDCDKSYNAAEVESLRAALQTLGDVGGSGDLFPRLDSPKIPQPHMRTKRRSRPGSVVLRPSRDVTEYRAKREARNNTVADLKAQIKELQRILDETKTNKHNQDIVLSGLQLALDGEWEQMSKRQKRQRIAAEIANASLRQFTVAQLKVAQTVERLLNKVGMMQQYVGSEVTFASIEKYSGPLFDLDGLLDYLDDIRGRTHTVLSSGHFAEYPNGTFREMSFTNYGPDGLQIELAISCVLPFSVEVVAGALWKNLTVGKQIVRNVASKVIRENPKISFFNFISENRRGDTVAGTTHGQAASRRYKREEDGSTTLLSRIVMRSFDLDGQCTGIMKGDGWIQLQSMTEKTTEVTQDVTRLRWCRRAITRPQNHEKVQPGERSLWVDAMVARPMRNHWQREMDQDVQAIENLALHPSAVDAESICALLDFNIVGNQSAASAGGSVILSAASKQVHHRCFVLVARTEAQTTKWPLRQSAFVSAMLLRYRCEDQAWFEKVKINFEMLQHIDESNSKSSHSDAHAHLEAERRRIFDKSDMLLLSVEVMVFSLSSTMLALALALALVEFHARALGA